MAQLAEKMSLENNENTDVKIFSSDDFSNPNNEPNGTRHSEVFGKKVNVDVPVYKLAPGTELTKVENHVKKLYQYQPDFLKLILKSEIQSPSYLGKVQSIKNKILKLHFLQNGFTADSKMAFLYHSLVKAATQSL